MSGGSSLELVICHVSATVQPNEWVEVLVCKVFVEGGSWYCNWWMCSCCKEMHHHLVVASAFWHLMWFSKSQENESSIPPAESINCVQVCVDESPYAQYVELLSAASHWIRMRESMFRLFFGVSAHEHHVDAHLGSFTRSSDTLKYVNSKTRWFWSLAFCWEDLSIVLFKKNISSPL